MKKKKNMPESGDGLTNEELSMLKSSVESEPVDRSTLPHFDNSERAKFFRGVKKNKLFTAAVALIAVCAIALISVGIFFISKAIQGRPNTDDFTLIIGDKSYTVKYEDAMRDDVLYIDMYKIASYANLTRTGTSDRVKFTSDEHNYLRFENNSTTAVINGALVEIGGSTTVTAEVCEVPFNFLLSALGQAADGGLSLTLNRETNTIRVMRRMYRTEQKDVYEPVEILFHTEGFQIIQAIDYSKEEAMEYEYGIDISDYLEYIDPENADDYLILANKQNPVSEDYSPSDLTTVKCRAKNEELQLRLAAERALYAMMLEMEQAGIDNVLVTSAYRDYSYQKNLFDRYVSNHISEGKTEEEAIAAALEYSARPGTSEHQTGLCIDFITDEMGGKLDQEFENYDAYRWLSANAYKYGFILRYPADKVDVTGYKYEPWHYRFVGRTTATQIYTSGLCFEEYLNLN